MSHSPLKCIHINPGLSSVYFSPHNFLKHGKSWFFLMAQWFTRQVQKSSFLICAQWKNELWWEWYTKIYFPTQCVESLILNFNYQLLCSEFNHSTLIRSGWMVCSLDWPALMQTSCNEFYKVSYILKALRKNNSNLMSISVKWTSPELCLEITEELYCNLFIKLYMAFFRWCVKLFPLLH